MHILSEVPPISRRQFFTAAFAFLLTSCTPQPTPVDPTNLAQFVEGRTSFSEVVKALGKPNRLIRQSNGASTIIYTSTHADGSWQNVVPLMLGTVPRNVEQTRATFHFDPRGVLQSYEFTQESVGGVQ